MWNLFIRSPANNSKNDTDMSGKNISRRDFLQRAAVIGGAAMMPSVAMGFNGGSSPSPRKVGANDKVNVALIGIGNRGGTMTAQNHCHTKHDENKQRYNAHEIVVYCLSHKSYSIGS